MIIALLLWRFSQHKTCPFWMFKCLQTWNMCLPHDRHNCMPFVRVLTVFICICLYANYLLNKSLTYYTVNVSSKSSFTMFYKFANGSLKYVYLSIFIYLFIYLFIYVSLLIIKLKMCFFKSWCIILFRKWRPYVFQEVPRRHEVACRFRCRGHGLMGLRWSTCKQTVLPYLPLILENLTFIRYNRTSMARTSWGPWEFVLNMSSSSHWRLIAPGQK